MKKKWRQIRTLLATTLLAIASGTAWKIPHPRSKDKTKRLNFETYQQQKKKWLGGLLTQILLYLSYFLSLTSIFALLTILLSNPWTLEDNRSLPWMLTCGLHLFPAFCNVRRSSRSNNNTCNFPNFHFGQLKWVIPFICWAFKLILKPLQSSVGFQTKLFQKHWCEGCVIFQVLFTLSKV